MMFYLLSVGIILSLLHLFFTYNERARLIRKIPGPKEKFLFAHALEFIFLSPVKLFYVARRYANSYKRLYKFWCFLFMTVNIYNPEDIETVISSSQHIEKGAAYIFLKPWLREGLLLSKGSKWQQRRKILTPAFHFNILRHFRTILEKNSCQLVASLAQTRGDMVDIVPVLSEYTLNCICETAMGTTLHEQTKRVAISYKNAIYELGKLMATRYCKLYLATDIIFNMSTLAEQQKKHLKTVQSFTERIIRERKDFVDRHDITTNKTEEETDDESFILNHRKNRVAMLDLLILAEKEGIIDCTGTQEEVDTFLFEGHDTTASGLTFCLMLIANHKDIQDKIFSELCEIFGDSTRLATIEDLSMMKYLECSIKESLRLYPPVPFMSRCISETVTLSNFSVPKGTHCNIHIYDLHRSEDLYKNAHVFDPDRFLPENSIGRHPYAYIPFSAGPRNCIGQRFAMMELKSCVSAILRRFELQPVTRPEDLVFKADVVLRNTKPVYVKFLERN